MLQNLQSSWWQKPNRAALHPTELTSPTQCHLLYTSASSLSTKGHNMCCKKKIYLKCFHASLNFCIILLVHLYRSEVHNDDCSDDHEAKDEGNDAQVEGFPTQLLRAVIVLLIITPLGLYGEWEVKWSQFPISVSIQHYCGLHASSYNSQLQRYNSCCWHINSAQLPPPRQPTDSNVLLFSNVKA